MGLLAGVCYDPATVATAATSSLLAMTALDTTNLTVSFTAPANGCVIVKMTTVLAGSAATPQILLGVMEHSGGAVVARKVPQAAVQGTGVGTTIHVPISAVFPVTGLSAGTHTWDAGYAVQVVQASSAVKWGGPDNTTTNDAFGAFTFEVWDAANLLACKWYDPAAAVSKATSSLLAQTAIDTTNLRATFTAPASGNVFVRCHGGAVTGSGGIANIFLGALESTTIVGRVMPILPRGNYGTLATTDNNPPDGSFVVTGVSAGSHSYDLAYGVDITSASTNLKYGGPDNTAGADAWGGIGIEVWDAS